MSQYMTLRTKKTMRIREKTIRKVMAGDEEKQKKNHTREGDYLDHKFLWFIYNSLHLARKYAGIFVRGHYLFREANSFPRA